MEANRIGYPGAIRVRRSVRREPCEVLVFSGCKSHPATGSLQPVAIGAAVEVTKLSEPSRQTGRCGDSASRQAVTRVNVEQASKRPMWTPTLASQASFSIPSRVAGLPWHGHRDRFVPPCWRPHHLGSAPELYALGATPTRRPTPISSAIAATWARTENAIKPASDIS